MRRLLLALSFLLIATASHASTKAYDWSSNHGSGTTATCTVPNYYSGATIIGVAAADNGATITASASGWNSDGSNAGNIWQGAWDRTATGSEPANYQWTWTGTANWVCMLLVVGDTVGVTPVIDLTAKTFTNSSSAGGLAAPALTTTVANDVIFDFFVSPWNIGSAPEPGGTILTSNQSFINEAAGYFGQGAAAAAITPSWNPGHSPTNIDLFRIAFKSNTTTAANFKGIGLEKYDASGVGSKVVAVPTNTSTGDALVAAIGEIGSSGIAISPPSDISLRQILQTFTGNGVSTCSVTDSSKIKVGDQLIALMKSAHGVTSTSGPTGFTKILTNDTNFLFTIWTKTAVSGDIGATFTWTNGSNNFIDCIMDDFFSNSAGTLSVEANSGITTAGSGTTYTPAAVTTLGVNRLIVEVATQFAGNNITLPGTVIDSGVTAGHGDGFGYYPQASTGASATPQATSSGSSTWEGVQLSVSSGGAGSSWTQIGSSIVDPGSTNELDLYSHVYAAGDPSTWPWIFASNPSKSVGIISAWANLDATTPVDTSGTLGSMGLDNGYYPIIAKPTANDELLYKVIVPTTSNGGYQFPDVPIFNGSGLTAHLSSIAGDLPLIVNSAGFTGNFSSATLGLKSATAPTYTTANARVNQAAVMVFSTSQLNYGPWFMP